MLGSNRERANAFASGSIVVMPLQELSEFGKGPPRSAVEILGARLRVAFNLARGIAAGWVARHVAAWRFAVLVSSCKALVRADLLRHRRLSLDRVQLMLAHLANWLG